MTSATGREPTLPVLWGRVKGSATGRCNKGESNDSSHNKKLFSPSYCLLGIPYFFLKLSVSASVLYIPRPVMQNRTVLFSILGISHLKTPLVLSLARPEH